ncbi:MAG: type II toxin-antitoxin system RelE/ParE family toxin [Chromatiales bacterium]|nr:type II toxin-antitoxin system RelE/ParE family toxin [Chromatiales bacterium]
MTLRVVFRRPAQHEFREAALWYEARRPGLGAAFRARVNSAILAAAEAPLRFPRVLRDIRCVRVRRFPYSVFFITEPELLVVLAVFHARRDPARWGRRT